MRVLFLSKLMLTAVALPPPEFPPDRDPTAGECWLFPFYRGIGAIPCEKQGPTLTCGNYQVRIAVNTFSAGWDAAVGLERN